MRCFTFFTHCNLGPAAGLSLEAETGQQRGPDGGLLTDPRPAVADGCGVVGRSRFSAVPWSHILSPGNLGICLYKDKRLCFAQESISHRLSPALFFSSKGLTMSLKDQQIEVQGFRSSHWADSCFP